MAFRFYLQVYEKDSVYPCSLFPGLALNRLWLWYVCFSGVRPFLCDLCGQCFTGSSMLSKHKLMKHKPKHLKCPHCDYTTAVLTWLKDHMRRHSQESPFQCTFCTYTAKSAGRLKVRTSQLRLSSFSKIGVCFGEYVGLFFMQKETNILQPITITQA